MLWMWVSAVCTTGMLFAKYKRTDVIPMMMEMMIERDRIGTRWAGTESFIDGKVRAGKGTEVGRRTFESGDVLLGLRK